MPVLQPGCSTVRARRSVSLHMAGSCAKLIVIDVVRIQMYPVRHEQAQPHQTACCAGSGTMRERHTIETHDDARKRVTTLEPLTQPDIIRNDTHDFAHPSEGEVARLLDYYQVQYEYEPRTFPLEWTEDGRITLSFTPDFYLPEFDLYVELTTLKQSLVTKKNRKLRRLRELYPEINIKLFYLKDFRNLMAKYGLPPASSPLEKEDAPPTSETGFSHDANEQLKH